jgi:hypothetical protein
VFAANGVFEPLEVAFNRALGIVRNRSYFRNQLVSLGLIFACGTLAFGSILLTAANQELARTLLGRDATVAGFVNLVALKVVALPMFICMLFLIYWLLPNGSVAWRRVLPVSLTVGLTLEGLKYLNILVWPFFRRKLQQEYGPFLLLGQHHPDQFLRSDDHTGRCGVAGAIQSNSGRGNRKRTVRPKLPRSGRSGIDRRDLRPSEVSVQVRVWAEGEYLTAAGFTPGPSSSSPCADSWVPVTPPLSGSVAAAGNWRSNQTEGVASPP